MLSMQNVEEYINEQVTANKLTREHADELIAILYGEERTTHHTVNVFCNSKTNEWVLQDIGNHNISSKYKLMFPIDYEGYTIFHAYKLPRPAFSKEDVESMLQEILEKEEQKYGV